MKKSVYTSVAAAALLATVATPVTTMLTATNQSTVSAAVAPATPAEQNAFIARLAPFARKAAIDKGLYPSLAMAQAIKESGWGKSALSQYNNLFGLKFKVGEDEGKYDKVNMTTTEVVDGVTHTMTLPFRSYPTFDGSMMDYANKLRYAPNLPANNYSGTWIENAGTVEQAAQGLFPKANGDNSKLNYATSNKDKYVGGLIDTINKYNLKRFDPQMTPINKTMYANSTTGVYNTYTPVKQQMGSAVEGQSYKVTRMVTLPDNSTFYEIGAGKWVLTSKMSGTKTDNFQVTPMSGVARIHEPHGWAVAVWTAPNGHTIPNKFLPNKSGWKIFGKAEYGARIWYKVGANQWIDSQYATIDGATKPEAKPDTSKETPVKGIGTINYVPNYYVFLRDQNGAMTSQKLKHGFRYKVFAKKMINGKEFYRLGSQKQWIEAQYLKF